MPSCLSMKKAGLLPALLCLVWCLPSPALAQASPTRVYEGTIGGDPAELITLEDYHNHSVSGYLLNRKSGHLMKLEETPRDDGAPLTIDVIDDRTGRVSSALAFPRFTIDASGLTGTWVDLRTRKRAPARFRRTAYYTPDAGDSYDGEVLQGNGDTSFLFRVHARRSKGEYGGLVDRIDIYDRASGRRVQSIDHLILAFNGTETLTFRDINGDGKIDFYAQRMAIDANGGRVTGNRTYYLFDGMRFSNFAPLEDLQTKGDVTLPKPGWVDFLPAGKTDWDNRTQTWDHYKFVTPRQLKFQASEERPF